MSGPCAAKKVSRAAFESAAVSAFITAGPPEIGVTFAAPNQA
jgi:hypothetical protein